MRSTRVMGRRMTRALAHILIIAVFGSTTVLAQARPTPVAAVSTVDVASEAIPVSLLVGRSAVIDVGTPITRVSLTSADIADALVTSSSQLLINGKTPGTISMFVWERGGGIRRYEIAVQRDLATLDAQLRELFPREPIQAHGNGRQIVLSGTVSSKAAMEKAIDVAAGFVGKREEVISLLQAPAAPRNPQVLLQVRFAEVSRSALTELGLSIFTSPLGIKNTLGRVTTQQFPGAGFEDLEWTKESGDFGAPVTSAKGKFTFSDFLNFFVLSERFDIGLLVRALQSRGLFESLAEPNLVAESGKEASFLAGGEFPIPIAQGSGANIGISVLFKEFGVRLSFLPTVIDNRVHLKVRPEVSMLDFTNAVVLGGFRIPALTTRRTETELELIDGQTFAIAGLMNNTMNQTLQRVPGIGDIPILGHLFRSKAAQKEQTELVVIITPHILPANSPGVTSELPRLQEPFLPKLQERDTIPSPPPSFPEPARSPAATSGTPVTPVVAPPAAAPQIAPPAPVPQVTADERQVVERRQREERTAAERADKAARAAQEQAAKEQRAAAEKAKQSEQAAQRQLQKEERVRREAGQRDAAVAAQAVAKRAEEERRVQAAERQRQERLAREQAVRDAAAAKQAAAAASRQAEADRKRAQAIAEAQARVRAAQAAYQAELERNGGTR